MDQHELFMDALRQVAKLCAVSVTPLRTTPGNPKLLNETTHNKTDGANPNETTSHKLSISTPNSEEVWIRRAILPSSQSVSAAAMNSQKAIVGAH